jgi:hypothetical protein
MYTLPDSIKSSVVAKKIFRLKLPVDVVAKLRDIALNKIYVRSGKFEDHLCLHEWIINRPPQAIDQNHPTRRKVIVKNWLMPTTRLTINVITFRPSFAFTRG